MNQRQNLKRLTANFPDTSENLSMSHQCRAAFENGNLSSKNDTSNNFIPWNDEAGLV
jgi:hypothetical protein